MDILIQSKKVCLLGFCKWSLISSKCFLFVRFKDKDGRLLKSKNCTSKVSSLGVASPPNNSQRNSNVDKKMDTKIISRRGIGNTKNKYMILAYYLNIFK